MVEGTERGIRGVELALVVCLEDSRGSRGGGRLEVLVGDNTLGELLLGLLETSPCMTELAVNLEKLFNMELDQIMFLSQLLSLQLNQHLHIVI